MFQGGVAQTVLDFSGSGMVSIVKYIEGESGQDNT